MVLVESGEDCY